MIDEMDVAECTHLRYPGFSTRILQKKGKVHGYANYKIKIYNYSSSCNYSTVMDMVDSNVHINNFFTKIYKLHFMLCN